MRYRYEEHDSDLIITGSNMTPQLYETILQTLPAHIKDRVIGWKRIGCNA